MPKTVIDIQVNDAPFRNFQRTFQQFQQRMGSTPLSWKPLAQGIKGFQDLVREEVAAIGKAKMLAEVHNAAVRLTRTQADVWRDMGRTTKTVASNIRDMTSSLLRWTSLTAVFSGLIGAGGLFGIARLAEQTAGARRQSLGTGASVGETRAFGNAFGRLTDPDALLGGIDQALRSASGKATLFGAGVRDLSGSTADVAIRYLTNARKFAKGSDPSLDDVNMKGFGFDKNLSMQDFRRLRGTSDTEFNSLLERYRRNSGPGGLGISEKDQQAYQNFVTTLDEAEKRINAVFVRGIAPLIDPLEKLSIATADVLKTFLEAPKLKEWIEGAGKGLKTFADYIGTPEFSERVKKFVDGLGQLGDKIEKFVGWFGGGSSKPAGATLRGMQHHRGRGGPAADYGIFGTINPYFDTGPDTIWGYLKKQGAATGVGDIKAGAGKMSGTTKSLYELLRGGGFGINQFTSFDDAFHGGKGGHGAGRALDLTLENATLENYAKTAERIRGLLRARGIEATVLDEANNPIPGHTTGRHLHVEAKRNLDLTVYNTTGNSHIIAGGQMGTGGSGL